MTLDTILLMPPLLLAQQITATLHTRAKTHTSGFYVIWAACMSHTTWVVSNAFSIWRIGAEFQNGFSWSGAFAVIWYASFCTLGNWWGQKLAIWYESRYH